MAKITPLPKTPNVDGSVSKSLWDWLIKIGLAVNQLIGWSNDIKPADVGAAPAAAGVPAGGTAGQVLGKKTGTNYDTEWQTVTSSGGDFKADGSVTMTGQIKSSVATGTAPLQVASTTAVTNLNADMIDGKHLTAAGNAPIFACRAWVSFNGTGTVAIKSSGNVSSVVDNGVGTYAVNFATAMPDTNYAVTGGADRISDSRGAEVSVNLNTRQISSVNILVNGSYATGVDYRDSTSVDIAIYR